MYKPPCVSVCTFFLRFMLNSGNAEDLNCIGFGGSIESFAVLADFIETLRMRQYSVRLLWRPEDCGRRLLRPEDCDRLLFTKNRL
jgi:hypothetical protein